MNIVYTNFSILSFEYTFIDFNFLVSFLAKAGTFCVNIHGPDLKRAAGLTQDATDFSPALKRGEILPKQI